MSAADQQGPRTLVAADQQGLLNSNALQPATSVHQQAEVSRRAEALLNATIDPTLAPITPAPTPAVNGSLPAIAASLAAAPPVAPTAASAATAPATNGSETRTERIARLSRQREAARAELEATERELAEAQDEE